MNLLFQLLSDQEAQRIHEASLEVLKNTGMRLESERLLEALKKRGAAVGHGVVRGLPGYGRYENFILVGFAKYGTFLSR